MKKLFTKKTFKENTFTSNYDLDMSNMGSDKTKLPSTLLKLSLKLQVT